MSIKATVSKNMKVNRLKDVDLESGRMSIGYIRARSLEATPSSYFGHAPKQKIVHGNTQSIIDPCMATSLDPYMLTPWAFSLPSYLRVRPTLQHGWLARGSTSEGKLPWLRFRGKHGSLQRNQPLEEKVNLRKNEIGKVKVQKPWKKVR